MENFTSSFWWAECKPLVYGRVLWRKGIFALVDIGTCGLDVIHVSLKTEAQKGTDWDVQKLLKSMWQLLYEVLAQTVLYENICESLDYPVKFCGHRWVENEDCAARAESLLDGYRKFITNIFSLKESEQPDGKKKSFTRLKSMIHDPLLAAKLKFFEMVAGKMNSFLRGFQTCANDSLHGWCYWWSSLQFLEENHLERCLKKCSSLYNPIQLNPLDKNIRKPPESIDVGFEAKQKLEGVKSSTKELEVKKAFQSFQALRKPLGLCENVFYPVSWSVHNGKRLQHQQTIPCWESEVKVFGCS